MSSSIVDREKECPFLLRIFYRNGGHNSKNATLEEIAQLIEQVVPEARDPDARIVFRLIYLDSERARYNSRDLGRVVPANPTEDQKKTLDACNFFIGDYLDVAIFIGPPASIRNKFAGREVGRSRMGGDRFGGRLSGGNDRFSGRRNYGAPYNRDNNGRYGGRLGRRDRY
ncbi:MAG: Sin3 associated polypeptide p18-domain-containing protein [Benjaminiella poitrasii]|nr:MAG: Sin3 associated polypeptide p18-domain-containing protein [Benjaminiella poitrasii]